MLSSRFEGLGIVLIEALALGTPCVATQASGGIAEVLIDEQRDLVTEPTAAALAEGMLKAVTSPITIRPAWVERFAEPGSLANFSTSSNTAASQPMSRVHDHYLPLAPERDMQARIDDQGRLRTASAELGTLGWTWMLEIQYTAPGLWRLPGITVAEHDRPRFTQYLETRQSGKRLLNLNGIDDLTAVTLSPQVPLVIPGTTTRFSPTTTG